MEIMRLGGLEIIIRVLEFRDSFESADSTADAIYQQAMSALGMLASNRRRW